MPIRIKNTWLCHVFKAKGEPCLPLLSYQYEKKSAWSDALFSLQLFYFICLWRVIIASGEDGRYE